jgi:hypothetical protein
MHKEKAITLQIMYAEEATACGFYINAVVPVVFALEGQTNCINTRVIINPFPYQPLLPIRLPDDWQN